MRNGIKMNLTLTRTGLAVILSFAFAAATDAAQKDASRAIRAALPTLELLLERDAARVELLLARGADLDAQDQRGVGVLHACAMHGLAEPCRVLLRAGANPALIDALGRTAAEVALMLGYADLAAEIKRAAGKERVARAW